MKAYAVPFRTMLIIDADDKGDAERIAQAIADDLKTGAVGYVFRTHESRIGRAIRAKFFDEVRP